ncbi:hypothetical protein M378DRAFT_168463, partial [Amanita muscaria Koide BX008]
DTCPRDASVHETWARFHLKPLASTSSTADAVCPSALQVVLASVVVRVFCLRSPVAIPMPCYRA